MSSEDLVVVTNGLTKQFGDFVAVDDFNLEVRGGTVVSLLGPNGAGKTTIVRMLATLDQAHERHRHGLRARRRERVRHGAQPALAHGSVRRARGQPHGAGRTSC